MSFVTTRPEALSAVASALGSIGDSMAAQNAAAAAPTTGVAPAAADEVSALQAAQFAAYGTWYQQVSTQAKMIHQALVTNLASSAGSYGTTESANRVSTGTASLSGLRAAAADPPSTSSILDLLSGDDLVSTSAGATLGTPIEWGQNVGAAASDFISLGAGQFAPAAATPAPTSLTGDIGAAVPAGASTPAVPLGATTPIVASMGQGSSIGALSAPPSWATTAVSAVTPNPGLDGTGFSSATPHAASMTTTPAGVPSLATTGRGGSGLGAPRYGVKPTVMPRARV